MSEQERAAGQYKEKVGELEANVNQLVKFGGFDLLEMTIDGVKKLNPERKALKRIFLGEANNAEERSTLRDSLSLWVDILSGSDDLSAIIADCEAKAEAAGKTYNSNMKTALESTADLEKSYRSVASFFANSESDKIKNVSFMNATPDQVKDLDNPRFINHVSEELKQCYDRLDLRDNYSMVVLPGYLGSAMVVDKWARIANENKVTLVTDFEHMDRPDDVMDAFEAANLTGGDVYKSNVCMSCNWLVGRKKDDEVGEEEDLHIPPAGALAGKIYQSLMSQVTAGKKHGSLNEVDAVAFELRKSEIADLEKMGLIPMVNEYGKVMAFSAKTLFNGDNIGLQTYSVVRVFDHVAKVLMDFLNRRAFENFNVNTQKEIRSQIVRWLDGITGPGKLIEKFEIKRFVQDPNQKDRVLLDIHMVPYFPAKNFMFKLDGRKGDDGADWNAEYGEE